MAIRIGPEDVLEVSSYGLYTLNGISNAEMPANVAGYTVALTNPNAKEHIFLLTLGADNYLEVKVYKDLVSVKFNLAEEMSEKDFAGSTGLVGSWKDGVRLARDGTTILWDDNEYGQEWQVNHDDPQLFMMNRAPQFPAQCDMPTPGIQSLRNRRLAEGISQEMAEDACSQLKKGHGFEQCVYDVLATQDLAAGKAGAY